jgi:hypothetical protein
VEPWPGSTNDSRSIRRSVAPILSWQYAIESTMGRPQRGRSCT